MKPNLHKTKRRANRPAERRFAVAPLLGHREQELLNYIRQQFPATVGHIPLAEKIHSVWQEGWRSGMVSAADIVRERAALLQKNNCNDTIREHYSEQAIRSAAWPNA